MRDLGVKKRDLAVIEGVEKRILSAVLFAAARARLGKWDVFNRAMDDTRRAARLAVILAASALPPAAVAALVYFLGRR